MAYNNVISTESAGNLAGEGGIIEGYWGIIAVFLILLLPILWQWVDEQY